MTTHAIHHLVEIMLNVITDNVAAFRSSLETRILDADQNVFRAQNAIAAKLVSETNARILVQALVRQQLCVAWSTIFRCAAVRSA